MKRLTLILMAVAVAGCALDRNPDYNPELRLMFQPVMYMHMAQDEVECYPDDETFGVIAWVHDDGCHWTEGKEYLPLSEARSCQMCMFAEQGDEPAQETLWSVSDELMWPSEHENLTFIAYSPFDAACSCNCRDGVVWDAEVNETTPDLLYTRPIADRNKIEDGWIVPVKFEHALCEVGFRIKSKTEKGENIVVTSIAIDELLFKGTFRSLRDPQWEYRPDICRQTFFHGHQQAPNLPETVGMPLLTLPQELDTKVTVEFEYTNIGQNTITQTISTVPLKTRLEAGRSYTYTLFIGIDGIRFQEEMIEDRLKK